MLQKTERGGNRGEDPKDDYPDSHLHQVIYPPLLEAIAEMGEEARGKYSKLVDDVIYSQRGVADCSPASMLLKAADGHGGGSSEGPNVTPAQIQLVSAVTTAVYFASLAVLLVTVPSSDGAWCSLQAEWDVQVHGYAAAAFTTCLAIKVFSCLLTPDLVGVGTDSPAIAIAVIGTTCYAVSAMRLAPVIVSPYAGSLIYPHRLLSWATTTCLLVFSIWASTGGSVRSLLLCCLLNMGIMLNGLLASICPGLWVPLIFFFLSGLCQVGTCSLQYSFVTKTIRACEEGGLQRRVLALTNLRTLLIVSWTIFPASFLLQFSGLAPQTLTEALFCLADVLAKTVLQSALSQGLVSWAADQRQRRLDEISLGLLEQLQEKERKQNLFVSSLAHELRTPLNGIVGLTEVLFHSEYHRLSPSAQEMFSTVRTTGQRFHRLVNAVLDSVRLAENKLELNVETVNLHTLLEDAVLLNNHLLHPSTKLEVHQPHQLPTVRGDFNRLTQVLSNLLSNAARFTDSGVISLSVWSNESTVSFEVKDTGLGIPPDCLNKIFAPYEQLDMSKTRSHGGVGLGLTLAKQLVEAHGGTITARSSGLGKGSCFTITIPAVSSDESTFSVERSSHTQIPRRSTVDCDTGFKGILNKRNETSRSSSHASLPHQDSRSSQHSQDSRPDRGRDLSASSGTPRVVTIAAVEASSSSTSAEPFLRSAGFQVSSTRDAGGVLQILGQSTADNTAAAPPAIVVVSQEGRAAVETARLIRLKYPPSQVAIIMVAAEDRVESLMLGMLETACNDLLTTPYLESELLRKVQLHARVLQYESHELEFRQYHEVLKQVMPSHVVQRLKAGDMPLMETFHNVPVLFCEVIGLEELADASPDLVARAMDEFFLNMEKLESLHRVQRLEHSGTTIPVIPEFDIPGDQDDDAARLCQFAMSIADMVAVLHHGSHLLRTRIGIHCGVAVGCIVGTDFPRYYIFGRTVNVARQIMQTADPMTVQVSADVLQRVSGSSRGMSLQFSSLGTRHLLSKVAARVWVLHHGSAWQSASGLRVEVESVGEAEGSEFGTGVASTDPGSSVNNLLSQLQTPECRLQTVASNSGDHQPNVPRADSIGRQLDVLSSQVGELLVRGLPSSSAPADEMAHGGQEQAELLSRLEQMLGKLESKAQGGDAHREGAAAGDAREKLDSVLSLLTAVHSAVARWDVHGAMVGLRGLPDGGEGGGSRAFHVEAALGDLAAQMEEVFGILGVSNDKLDKQMAAQSSATSLLLAVYNLMQKRGPAEPYSGRALAEHQQRLQQLAGAAASSRGQLTPRWTPPDHVVEPDTPRSSPSSPSRPGSPGSSMKGSTPLASPAHSVPEGSGRLPQHPPATAYQAVVEEDKRLLLFLQQSGLEYLYPTLSAKEATLGVLIGLGPEELSSFGVPNPGVQHLLHGALQQLQADGSPRLGESLARKAAHQKTRSQSSSFSGYRSVSSPPWRVASTSRSAGTLPGLPEILLPDPRQEFPISRSQSEDVQALEDASLLALLTAASLEDLFPVLTANEVTVSILKGLQGPQDLATFGVHDPAMQQALHQALCSASLAPPLAASEKSFPG
eukprot:CAMPEP_0117678414 /NCGR_PEP_ID=MMETSP0804-20121206/17284_1 /TAXON_ID=1074897 /ORGANISM="Tetraselmis astigmatica, Strain CCMP880" /LENGTH=1578 /DNA_ID=CAMNT_0005487799 /DNA_START=308 /DNA_END=5045 /DNA_ORIENTATION=+